MGERTHRLSVWAALAWMCAASGALAANSDNLWVKAGATAATTDAELAACDGAAKTFKTRTVRRARTARLDAAIFIGAVGGAVGAATYEVVAAGQQLGNIPDFSDGDVWVAGRILHHCMIDRGYVWLPLTEPERAALPSETSAKERQAWIEQFLAGDISGRIATANSLIPALPAGRVEPFVFGGVRFDPTKLSVNRQVEPNEGVALSGVVTVAHEARLASAAAFPTVNDRVADAGSLFYQVVGTSDYDPHTNYWCGPFRQGTAAPVLYCLASSDDGYELWGARHKPPFAPPPVALGGLAGPSQGGLSFVPADQDPIGPMKFVLKLVWVDFKTVELDAVLTRQGGHMTLWRANLPFDSKGVAVLPFWTHRLLIYRQLAGWTVELRADGDGKGWLDAKQDDW